jgi:cullin-associated NEDD8-dissociated protein 1
MTRVDSSQDDYCRASNRRHDCRKGMRQADSQVVGAACDCKLVIWSPSRESDGIRVQPGIPPDTLIETLSILSILVTHFPTYVSSLSLVPPPIQTITPLLTHARPAVRKRAIVALSQFVPLSAPDLSAHLLSAVINPNLQLSAPLEKQRTTVNLVAAIARTSPQRLASGLRTIILGLLRVVDRDDEELREGALQVKCSLYLTCSLRLPLSRP